MIVKCDMMNCPWNINTDCSKPLVSIRNGQCIIFNQIFFAGAKISVDDRLKQKPTIVEVDYDECGNSDEVECERELCEETLQETSREFEKAGSSSSEDREGS